MIDSLLIQFLIFLLFITFPFFFYFVFFIYGIVYLIIDMCTLNFDICFSLHI